jgi:5-formyltetrahydrofolate cyclo-ligase
MSASHNIQSDKNHIRTDLLHQRGKCLAKDAYVAGEQIVNHLLALPVIQNAVYGHSIIGLYHPIRMEVDLFSHSGLLIEKGFQIALPRVRRGAIEFSLLEEDMKLISGVFGIMEPPLHAPCVSAADMFAVCLPGLAFDVSGARIGYGKGLYDQWLLPEGEIRPICIGIGYDFQILDDIPHEKHDRRMDYIVTPSGTRIVDSRISFDTDCFPDR